MVFVVPRASWLLLAVLLVSQECYALDGSRLKQRADAVLTLMS